MNPAEANKYATLERLPDSDIYVLTLQSKIMDVPMTRAIHHHLDTLELTTGPCCMISTAVHPKIFSAGLNFDTFKGHPIDVHNRLREIARLFGRMLQLPFPTISAINGECYAGGYMFATTHDFRFMRDDYGKICLPEINLGIPLPRAFNAVVQARVPIQHYSKMALLGKKYSPQEA
jgi:enoyl-CoA hydratase/carnithine racemase